MVSLAPFSALARVWTCICCCLRAEDGRTWPGEDQELDFAWEEVIGEDRENGTYFRWRDMTPAARDHAERAAEWLLEHDSGMPFCSQSNNECLTQPNMAKQACTSKRRGVARPISTLNLDSVISQQACRVGQTPTDLARHACTYIGVGAELSPVA